MKLHHTTTLASAMALLLAGGISACSDRTKTAGQQVDSVVAGTERAAAEIKSDVKQGAAEAKDAATQATTKAKQVIGDAAITTAVNAELLKDPSLSALKVDVDTRDGRVVLSGSAPNDNAKARATQMAQRIEGVTGVDNRLTVQQ